MSPVSFNSIDLEMAQNRFLIQASELSFQHFTSLTYFNKINGHRKPKNLLENLQDKKGKIDEHKLKTST